MWKVKVQNTISNDITHSFEMKLPGVNNVIDITCLENRIKGFLKLFFEICSYTNILEVYPIVFVAANDIISNSRSLHISESSTLKRRLIYEGSKYSVANCQLVQAITLITNLHHKEITQQGRSCQTAIETDQDNSILTWPDIQRSCAGILQLPADKQEKLKNSIFRSNEKISRNKLSHFHSRTLNTVLKSKTIFI